MYLLDTNICIYCIKQKPVSVLQKLQQNMNNSIFISSITLAELEFGVTKSQFPEKNRISLIEFSSIFSILPFDDKDAEVYGKVRGNLTKQGNIIGQLDMLIGSQAVAKKLTLVTNNVREFERIKDIRIENWV
ncbi:MAG: VapC toxin family PIN domain ribonuclease [Candidatus Wallbacteria bacterium HGW-Wallbacteria-1]|jgi:tRNA(fMet)-specific endonuclease VapC|uniref:VapC toxin family PIN domain ribonuclease n=1 Tax=Candidatus Wallbacteria bacterium HGW-Wallbacteria-1 TaxID=2013854 RepID=A0A2N1PLZ2_9BACT|nr:MAG: VapC toxin family PIN domain ribonuclease [Candidatus Wallbacteria bacterium HGW-Wallbacteria-1]